MSTFPQRLMSGWMPMQITGRTRVLAWASLASQTGIIATGGGVRLTGSGLGCPTWPRCTDDSFVPTAEMGVHGVIEFGNRLLTFVLSLIAILMFLAVLRLRHQRPDLFRLALVAGLSIPAQAGIGGLTVLTNLNPYVVGLHMAVSLVMVSVTTILVFRVYHGRARAGLAVGAGYHRVTWFAVLTTIITVVFGILTTGSGPHAGDEGAARNNLDSELLQHIHSWPSYLTFVLVVGLLLVAWRRGYHLTWNALTLGVMLVQITVGLWQARTGLPILLVGIHMVLAAAVLSALTAMVLQQRHPENVADSSVSSSSDPPTAEPSGPPAPMHQR